MIATDRANHAPTASIHRMAHLAPALRAACATGVAAALVLLLAVSALGSAPKGPASAWVAPVRVLGGRISDSALVLDSTNHVHAVAVNGSGVWYITNRTGSWASSLILPVTHAHPAWTDAAIALDDQQRVHITASPIDDAVPSTTLGVFSLTDRGRTRGSFPAQPTALVSEPAGEASLKVFHDSLDLAYEKFCCYPGPAPAILFRTNVSGSWTTAKVVKHGADPALRMGSDGRARIVFAGKGIQYATAGSATGDFTRRTVPGSVGSGVYASNPALALDASNRPYVAWCRTTASTEAVLLSSPSGQTWHQPLTIQSGACDLAFDLDTTGTPNVAVADGATIRNWFPGDGAWRSQLVTNEFNGATFALRRALSGRVDVIFSRLGGGLWLTHN